MNDREWLDARKKGVGGSEAAAVLGVSPWETALDVWARKKGLAPEQPDNLRFKIGRKFEGPIAELYAEQERVNLCRPFDRLLYHPTAPLVATPDRIIEGQKKGLEIKTAEPFMAGEWGEPGSDEIPLHYTAQVAVYMAVTGFPEWDVAVLFGTSDFRVYRLRRDMELEDMMIARVTEFWNRYVVGTEEPAIDASESARVYLARKYPRNIRPMLEASDAQDAAISKLLDVRQEIKNIESTEAFLENFLKSEIGENEGIRGRAGRVSWANTKDRTDVDWKSLAESLLPMVYAKEELSQAYIKQFTTVKPGTRRFTIYPTKLSAKKEEGTE